MLIAIPTPIYVGLGHLELFHHWQGLTKKCPKITILNFKVTKIIFFGILFFGCIPLTVLHSRAK